LANQIGVRFGGRSPLAIIFAYIVFNAFDLGEGKLKLQYSVAIAFVTTISCVTAPALSLNENLPSLNKGIHTRAPMRISRMNAAALVRLAGTGTWHVCTGLNFGVEQCSVGQNITCNHRDEGPFDTKEQACADAGDSAYCTTGVLGC